MIITVRTVIVTADTMIVVTIIGVTTEATTEVGTTIAAGAVGRAGGVSANGVAAIMARIVSVFVFAAGKSARLRGNMSAAGRL